MKRSMSKCLAKSAQCCEVSAMKGGSAPCSVLGFSLGLLWTPYLPVMTKAWVTSLVMDLLSGGAITCTILTHS